jgi:DMSO/TMAO reductase YedYZ molybdopterin-dependent catalytic subunit
MREEGDFEPNERMIKTKEAWARAKRGQDVHEAERPDRLPPGQLLRTNWPVLDLGYKPEIALSDWRLAVTGFVANPLTWTWEDFLAQPSFHSVSDFHCVTTWSTYDNEWEGVSFKRLIELVRPLSMAKFLLFTAYDDYTTNLPLEACDDEDVLLACRWNGQPLTREHGGPVRVIVPKRYAWKGAKWVKEIMFSDQDQKGFWEVRGYSNSALPWENDRYS